MTYRLTGLSKPKSPRDLYYECSNIDFIRPTYESLGSTTQIRCQIAYNSLKVVIHTPKKGGN
jgi:hypothetical protein